MNLSAASKSENTDNSSRNLTLDGLRGTAILLVMVTHFLWLMEGDTLFEKLMARIIDSMWLGVDLFFVLSGYLITGILIKARQKERYFRDFYIRRAFRIWPAYYVTLLILVVIASALEGDSKSQEFTIYSWFYVLHIQNWLPWASPDSFLVGADHFWSLAIEEQFYFVWPIVVLAAPSHLLKRICCLVIALSIFAKLVLLAAKLPTGTLYIATIARLDGLAAGALAASMTFTEAKHWSRLAKVFGIAGALGLVVTILSMPAEITGRKAVLESTFASIAFGAIFMQLRADQMSEQFHKIFQSEALVWLGKYSFSLYLLHFPAAMYARAFISENFPLIAGGGFNLVSLVSGAIALMISLPAAVLMHRFVELPMLNIRDKLTPPGKRIYV